MKRLFTFGCSYTCWHWPTWADLISTEFDEFYNYAIRGSGNRCIAERLSEAIINFDINENDLIIVQWTDFHRFDFHNSKLGKDINWACAGNIFKNEGIPKIILELWNEESYILHTLNFINMSIAMLKTTNSRWFMTSSINLFDDVRNFENFKKYQRLFSPDYWIEPIDNHVPRNTYKGIKMPPGTFSSILPWETPVDSHPILPHYRNWVMKNFIDIIDTEKLKNRFLDYDKSYEKILSSDLNYAHIDWANIEKKTGWHQNYGAINGI